MGGEERQQDYLQDSQHLWRDKYCNMPVIRPGLIDSEFLVSARIGFLVFTKTEHNSVSLRSAKFLAGWDSQWSAQVKED